MHKMTHEGAHSKIWLPNSRSCNSCAVHEPLVPVLAEYHLWQTTCVLLPHTCIACVPLVFLLVGYVILPEQRLALRVKEALLRVDCAVVDGGAVARDRSARLDDVVVDLQHPNKPEPSATGYQGRTTSSNADSMLYLSPGMAVFSACHSACKSACQQRWGYLQSLLVCGAVARVLHPPRGSTSGASIGTTPACHNCNHPYHLKQHCQEISVITDRILVVVQPQPSGTRRVSILLYWYSHMCNIFVIST